MDGDDGMMIVIDGKMLPVSHTVKPVVWWFFKIAGDYLWMRVTSIKLHLLDSLQRYSTSFSIPWKVTATICV